jgi:hypothetical protein
MKSYGPRVFDLYPTNLACMARMNCFLQLRYSRTHCTENKLSLNHVKEENFFTSYGKAHKCKVTEGNFYFNIHAVIQPLTKTSFTTSIIFVLF